MNPWIIVGAIGILLLTSSSKPDVKKKQEPGVKGPAPAPGVAIKDNGGAGVIVDLARTVAPELAKSVWRDIQSTPVDNQANAPDGQDADPGDDSRAPPPSDDYAASDNGMED